MLRSLVPLAALLSVIVAVFLTSSRHIPPARQPATYRVAVLDSAGKAAPFVAALNKAGFPAQPISDTDMADSARLNTRSFDALLLPVAADCPLTAKVSLLHFLQGGGDLIAIGGPIFEASRRRLASQWQSALEHAPESKVIVDFAHEDPARWQRTSNNMTSKTIWSFGPAAAPEVRAALCMEIPDLEGWDTLVAPAPESIPAADLVIFWAKGDARTPAMTFEFAEKDGSRWIASVPLTTQWRRYALTLEAFEYWRDNPSRGRGGPADRLHLENAARISVGIAQSHSGVAAGPHAFSISSIGVGKLPPGVTGPDLELPTLETLSPFYKVYHLPSLHPTEAQLRKSAETGDQTGPIVVPIPRPRGLGFAGDRPGRFIPLSEIRPLAKERLGYRASLYLNLSGPYRGSIFAHIAGADTPTSLIQDTVKIVRRMADGVFIEKAGAEQFSYFTDESVPLGVRIVNLSTAERTVRLTLRMEFHTRTSVIRVPPGGSQLHRERWKLPNTRSGSYFIGAEVSEGSHIIDKVRYWITAIATPHAQRPEFVHVRRGSFYAPPSWGSGGFYGESTEWHPYGVNYWQSNVAGTDPTEYALHWLSPGYYDPEIVESDLAHLRKLGVTTVSIQVTNPDHLRQANDFIFQAAQWGIRTNVFIAGAHPFQTDEKLFTRLIREGRFAGNPNIWAYDIAWEHHLGPHEERAKWDRDWERWIVERYGTVQHAEKNWGYPVPRDASGRITNPPDEQLRRDGPWFKMAAAYERCADDVISRRYGAIIRKIHALDPNHLISARSATQPSWTSWFAFDLAATGKHFDFSSPEGYGLRPEEAGFTVAYGRWAGNGKPVYWSEFGLSIFPYDTTGAKAAEQARLHRGFAQMLLDSGANGLASWWNVGGYRVDEKSDFGIFSPSGTPRSAALALNEYARRVTAPRSTKPPTAWVTIDRDHHAAAYQAVYENNKQSYVNAVKKGGMLGVRTAGTGTTSANCPLTAVGNVPYDGFNPLKFLNSEFNRVEIRNAAGKWQPVEDGDAVEVAGGSPIEARLSIGNTGEVRWLSAGNGAVRLIGDDRPYADSSAAPRILFAHPLPRPIARYEDVAVPAFTISPGIVGDHEVVFTLEAMGRARFGERRRVLLRVKR